MTPNPVCYNGLNLPENAIHIGQVSLGIKPKDYRADTSHNWRAGINPNGALVLYSNTYALGLSDQATAEPRIWWTNPAATVADFKLKIRELLSRLPERAAQNYEVFPTYDDAIDWLHLQEGQYMIVNDNYPEYHIPGQTCIFNIETGFHSSYLASSLHMHSIANPSDTVGNQLNSYALGAHGFVMTNVPGELNIGAIGQEPGITYSGSTGNLTAYDELPAAAFSTKQIVFEAVLEINYAVESTILSILNAGSGAELLNFKWAAAEENFVITYPSTGAIIRFTPTTPPWSGKIHLVASIPTSNDGDALTAAEINVNGVRYGVGTTVSSGYTWSSDSYIRIGNNQALTAPIHKLYSAKLHNPSVVTAPQLVDDIIAQNLPIVQARYSI